MKKITQLYISVLSLLALITTNVIASEVHISDDKDRKILNKKIDVDQDSPDTLKHLALKYIIKHNNQLNLGQNFRVSYITYVEDERKSAYVGYEATTKSGKETLIKIQLIKDFNGWRAVNQLRKNQINSAHPVWEDIQGTERRIDKTKAELVVAKKLESYLNNSDIISKVRTSSVNCYLTKTRHKASCRAVYGTKGKVFNDCHDKNYLLKKDKSYWIVQEEILSNQRVDYKTGELITKKPFSMSCS